MGEINYTYQDGDSDGDGSQRHERIMRQIGEIIKMVSIWFMRLKTFINSTLD